MKGFVAGAVGFVPSLGFPIWAGAMNRFHQSRGCMYTAFDWNVVLPGESGKQSSAFSLQEACHLNPIHYIRIFLFAYFYNPHGKLATRC